MMEVIEHDEWHMGSSTLYDISDNWTTAETDHLLLFYLHHINIFQGVNYNVKHTKWTQIANRVSKTIQSCQNKFYELQAQYYDIKQKCITEETDWPYYGIFEKIYQCHFSESLSMNIVHQSNDQVLGFDAVNMQILQYYIKYKHMFNSAQIGGEICLWSVISSEIGLTAEECAYRIRTIRYLHFIFKDKLVLKGKEDLNYEYLKLCQLAFNKNTKVKQIKVHKIKIQESKLKMAKAKWEKLEIKALLDYYDENYTRIKDYPKSEAWQEFAEKFGRSPQQCHSKLKELQRKFSNLNRKKRLRPNATVSWSLFNRFHEIHKKYSIEDEFSESEPILNPAEVILDRKQIKEENDSIELDEDVLQGKHSFGITTPPKGRKLRKISWTFKRNSLLIRYYTSFLRKYNGVEEQHMWNYISEKVKIPLEECKNQYLILYSKFIDLMERRGKGEVVDWDLLPLFSKLQAKVDEIKDSCKEFDYNKLERESFQPDYFVNSRIIEFLEYYLENLEEFLSPLYSKIYVWEEAGKTLGVPHEYLMKKLKSLEVTYEETKTKDSHDFDYFELFERIEEKKAEIVKKIKVDPNLHEHTKQNLLGYENWDHNEIIKLLEWYHQNVARFHNKKYKVKYLWNEAETALGIHPLRCYKKMRDLRNMYRQKLMMGTAARSWEYYHLMEKIYGTDLNNPYLARTRKSEKAFKLH